MNIFFYIFVAVGGGILAAILAITLVIFIVSFGGWLATLVPSFRKWNKDSTLQRPAAAEWIQKTAACQPKKISNRLSNNPSY